MKTLHILLIILLFAVPLYAEQALVLTEIEQIQEKIWYLQRDLAAQKTSLEKQKKQVDVISSSLSNESSETTNQLNSLVQLTNRQQESISQTESRLQDLNEALLELNSKVAQQDKTALEMAGKLGSLEGSLQALRNELSAQQERNDQVIVDMREQLKEAQKEITAAQQQTSGQINQIGLWGAGAAIFFAIILTITFVLGSNRGKKASDRDQPTRHEM